MQFYHIDRTIQGRIYKFPARTSWSFLLPDRPPASRLAPDHTNSGLPASIRRAMLGIAAADVDYGQTLRATTWLP